MAASPRKSGRVRASPSAPPVSGADAAAPGIAGGLPPAAAICTNDELPPLTRSTPLTRFRKYDGEVGSMLTSSKSSVADGSGPGGSAPGATAARSYGILAPASSQYQTRSRKPTAFP